jgi:very-short-patch-repair endonuclease
MFRTVLPLLDARSESPWESVMRVLHQAADIEVEPQYEIYDGQGRFVARADLRIRGTRRIHEYDGGGHRKADTHVADLDRDRSLVEAGWQRCGFTARSVLREGGATIASVDRLLGRSWDARRLQRWEGLVADSLFGPIGRARVRLHWDRALTRGNQPTNCGVGPVSGRELGSQVAS